MVTWHDGGIVLASRVHGEEYRIVSIFTKDHGKYTAMTYINKTSKYINFSNVQVTYNSKGGNSMGFWKLVTEDVTWAVTAKSGNHMFVCQSICWILNRLLPQGAAHPKLFDFTLYISKNLEKFSSDEIILTYAYFEYILLDNLGFGINLTHIPRFDECTDLQKFISSEQFRSEARHLLFLSEEIFEKHLVDIKNTYRSFVIKQLEHLLVQN